MKDKINKGDIGFIISIGVLLALLIIRCFYGFGVAFADEFSQPAVVKRFLEGDRLLIDDWQPATTLIGFFIFSCISFISKFEFSLLELRIFYVVFQFVVAALFLFFSGWKDKGTRICAIVYLCSTPYGIMSISYNTVAIGAFLIFLSLFMTEFRTCKVVAAGAVYAIATLANPYLAVLFFIYTLISIAFTLLKRQNTYFNIKRLAYVIGGIIIVFVPFCMTLITRGTIQEYLVNLSFIMNDKEHSEYGIFTKLVMSQYQIVRVYWRIWVPLAAIILIAYFTRRKENARRWIYVLVCAIVIYGTIRFAFIYGSVSINLMITPLLFWGIMMIVLLRIWNKNLKEYYNEIAWMIAGYLFAVCNYLATNTEILSMSAMLIIAIIASIKIAVRLFDERFDSLCTVAGYVVILVFVGSLLALRLTYIWGDSIADTFEAKVEQGVAKGIYTSEQTIKEYDEALRIIDAAGITSDDGVLFVPINALYYLETSGVISSPYVGRFEVNTDELREYYRLHPYKIPTKVVIINQNLNEYDTLVDYFRMEGYDYMIIDEKSVVLSRKN